MFIDLFVICRTFIEQQTFMEEEDSLLNTLGNWPKRKPWSMVSMVAKKSRKTRMVATNLLSSKVMHRCEPTRE